jgi:small subunit ribosomal protein S17
MERKDDAAGSTARPHRKVVLGVVLSDKMQKTIVVRSEWRVKHPRYGKIMTHSTKRKAHDEKGLAKKGDVVEIAESRPLSKTKRWRLVRVVRRGSGDLPAVSGVEETAKAAGAKAE